MADNFFAKNLKYLREKRNIKQGIMAEDLGIKQPTLSCWENGDREPDLDMIAKIAKYLNIYEDMVTNDLTLPKNNSVLDETEILFDKYKDILIDDDKETIKFLIEKRKREIDKQLGED